MHRFFVPPEYSQGDQLIFPEATAYQIRVVLRMNKGDRVITFDNGGTEAEVELNEITKHTVKGQIIRKVQRQNPLRTRLTLYQCLLKKENFEWVLQKGTEIGVACFVPVISERTVKRLSENKTERWERILIEASEQSGRVEIPLLEQPISFEKALLAAKNYDRMLIAWEDERSTGLRAALAGINGHASIAIMIGAEGGFSKVEVSLAQVQGLMSVSLGNLILRAETAALVAAANIFYELES